MKGEFRSAWRLTSLTPVHAEIAAEIHRLSFAQSWSAESIGELLAMPGAEGLLALQQDQPAGMILFRTAADETEILTLAVLPGKRRLGLASMLLVAASSSAGERGARTVFLEVAEDNAAAKALYRAAGFQIVGRRPGYYNAGADRVAAEIHRLDLPSRSDPAPRLPAE